MSPRLICMILVLSPQPALAAPTWICGFEAEACDGLSYCAEGIIPVWITDVTGHGGDHLIEGIGWEGTGQALPGDMFTALMTTANGSAWTITIGPRDEASMTVITPGPGAINLYLGTCSGGRA